MINFNSAVNDVSKFSFEEKDIWTPQKFEEYLLEQKGVLQLKEKDTNIVDTELARIGYSEEKKEETGVDPDDVGGFISNKKRLTFSLKLCQTSTIDRDSLKKMEAGCWYRNIPGKPVSDNDIVWNHSRQQSKSVFFVVLRKEPGRIHWGDAGIDCRSDSLAKVPLQSPNVWDATSCINCPKKSASGKDRCTYFVRLQGFTIGNIGILTDNSKPKLLLSELFLKKSQLVFFINQAYKQLSGGFLCRKIMVLESIKEFSKTNNSYYRRSTSPIFIDTQKALFDLCLLGKEMLKKEREQTSFINEGAVDVDNVAPGEDNIPF